LRLQAEGKTLSLEPVFMIRCVLRDLCGSTRLSLLRVLCVSWWTKCFLAGRCSARPGHLPIRGPPDRPRARV